MPLQNMKAIQTVTVGSGGAANITFSSIPQTYTDLKVVCSLRSTYAGVGDDVNVYFNGLDSNRTGKLLYGTGSSAASVNVNNHIGLYPGANATALTFSNGEFYIPNYTSSNFKSLIGDSVTENNATLSYTDLTGSMWSSTAAITSMTIYPMSGSWVEYSTATLYGVTNTITGGAKAYGGNVTEDDNYFYHTFLASGTFTPTQNLTADYLVVAGGGGASAGGGGAGGLRCTVGATGGGGSLPSAANLINATVYTITVGAGGAGVLSASATPGNGTASSIAGSGLSTISTTGGGGGGPTDVGGGNGAAGGSGGGAGGEGARTTNGGAGTANEGYAGGGNGGYVTAPYPGGGGGGAGAIGTTATNASNAGVGGNGIQTTINGTNTYFGGGGGGGYAYPGTNAKSGGLGGGGSGGALTPNYVGISGTANTGGGGGGSGSLYAVSPFPAGGNGGSGIVIIRYAK